MGEIKKILTKKKLQIFFLFYLLLVLPLLSPLAQNISWERALCIILINVVFASSLLVLSLFLTSKGEKIVYSLLLVVSILPGTIFLGYLLFARVLLEQNSVTSLFETNPEESKEFLMYYLNTWLVLGVSAYALFPAIMIVFMRSFRRLSIRKYKPIFVISLILIISIIFIPKLSRSVYFINFYETFISYKIQMIDENEKIAEREHFDYQIINAVNDTIPQTIVIVIGESLTRNHMQLYGYGRHTNPLLEAKGDSIKVYSDVVSPQVHTIPVMRSLFSFIEPDNPKFITEKPSLFEIFNRAGYDTYFISNQPFGTRIQNSYDVLLRLAKHKYDLSSANKHDEVVFDQLNMVLDKETGSNKLIIIQLIGNHMAYKFRYPPQFGRFDNIKDHFIENKDYVGEEEKKIIDEYDNSVLYNDFIIDQVMNSLIAKGGEKTAMIYLSDHGEELYDFRSFAGHAYEKASAYMCEIPFILWMSDKFAAGRDDIYIDVNRSYSTADFIYSLSNLAGLIYIDYDESRSIFSTEFTPRERFIGAIPYDDLIVNK